MKRAAVALLCVICLTITAWATSPLASDQEALLAFARAELIYQLEGGPRPTPPATARSMQRACFVTFFEQRQVVACFGSFTPRHADLAAEISDNIRLALKNDRRAVNLTGEQARRCDLQITFAASPEPISNWRLVDPLREGLFVERDDGHGVAIVPGEVRTARYAWLSALKRLGATETTPGLRLYRFKAHSISTRGRTAP